MDATERQLARASGITGVLSLLVVAGAGWSHPRPHSFANPDLAYLQLVTGHRSWWIVDHLLLAAGGLLGAATLVLVAQVLWHVSPLWARLGSAAAIASTGVTLAFFMVDGIAGREVALDWASAPPADREASFRAAGAVAQVASALEIGTQLFFFGITLLLFAAAAIQSRFFSRGLGYVGLAVGIAALATGISHAALGTRAATVYSFLTATVLGAAWIAAIGFETARRARRIEPAVTG